MALLLRRRAAGRPLLHGAQQQTRRTPLPLSNDGTDRRTDGRRTPDLYIDPAAHMQAVQSNPIQQQHAPLRLHSAVQRHQSPDRHILHQISSLMYPKIQRRQVITNVTGSCRQCL